MKEYNNITFSKKVGCGSIYCIFVEDENTFHRVFIRGDMARETPCGEIWLNTVARLLTYSLRRGLWEDTVKDGIIKQLMYKSEKCQGYVPNKEKITSCADAIGRCVLEYAKSRGWIVEKKETEQTKENKET